MTAPRSSDGDAARPSRALRLDLLIAVCALLISSFASAASWWQTRLLSEQTRLLQAQLGAQVWPYIGIGETLNDSTVEIKVENDGLGPAVMRNETVSVDGVPKPSLVAVLHAVLGPSLTAHMPHGERLALGVDVQNPGSVLRPGDSVRLLDLTSARYARRFMNTSARVNFRICYCAIIPGQCWVTDTATKSDPKPVSNCPEIKTDLMHSSPVNALSGTL